MLSPSANVAPPAAPRLPGSAALGTPSAAPIGAPSFSQMLSDQAEPPRPAPAQAAPRPADKASAEAAPAPQKVAPPTPRKEASAPKSTAGSARRDPASDASTATDVPAAGLAGRSDDAESITPTADATDGVASDEDDGADVPQVCGLNEFTQLIGMPPPGAPATMAGASRRAADAGDAMGRGDARRVGSALNAAVPQPSATDADTAAGEAPGTSPTGPAGDGGAPSADLASTRGAVSSQGDDTTAPPREDSRRADVDKHTRGKAQRAAEPGNPGEIATSRAPATELSAKAAQEQAQTGMVAQAAASGEPQAAARPGDNSPQNFAALMAQTLAPASAAEPGAPAASGRVHASMHSAAFAPELAAQVSLLAVDGVQTAQLQLNPAEMGPVAVQIVVDGAQAQVSFQAAQADTRQALEQSLPDLAAALQGQGLTLSGGGVFQQAPRDSSRPDGGSADGPGNDGTRAASRRVGATESMSTAAGLAPARRARGLLDTFA